MAANGKGQKKRLRAVARSTIKRTKKTPAATDAQVDELLTDPEKFCCPILQCLMDEPVVAEDGFTYERHAIQSALTHRWRSPMTGSDMGDTVLPINRLKSEIKAYKDEVVEKIIELVPRIDSQSRAAKLLDRAEELLRTRNGPGALSESATKKLKTVLLLRCKLPSDYHGDAIPELLDLLLSDKDASVLIELLEDYESLRIADWTESLDFNTLLDLHWVGWQHGLPSSSPRCQDLIDTELVSRLAKVASDAVDLQTEVDSVNDLWSITLELAKSTKLNCWVKTAALVFTSFWRDIGLLDDVKLGSLSEDLLKLAVIFMQDPKLAASDAEELWGCDLQLRQIQLPMNNKRADVLLELAERQIDDRQAKLELLLKAREADPHNWGVRKALKPLLLEMLDLEDRIDMECTLIDVCLEDDTEIPKQMLAKLQLEAESLQDLSATSLMTLAWQLSEDRPTDAARIAVLAAKKHEADENLDQAHKAFVLAYRWDLRNEDAREQMIEICAETSSRYMDLQMECNHLKAEVARLKATSVTWCLEEGVNFYPDKFPASRSYGVRSPHFYFSHFEGWMEFFPRGVAQAQASKASFQMFLNPTELLMNRLQGGRQRPSTSLSLRAVVRLGSVEHSAKVRIVGNQDCWQPKLALPNFVDSCEVNTEDDNWTTELTVEFSEMCFHTRDGPPPPTAALRCLLVDVEACSLDTAGSLTIAHPVCCL
ncbi:unnamed protein product [Cladocopium goreaui]|uniref:Bifunctional E2/E3 enzyme R795 n=1 Tax=Cladocopium goreaui TaxID=2562237 RepID=A0A9P1GP26_9DINO|nr:unnamed protein product [Cladocopium goreaui]